MDREPELPRERIAVGAVKSKPIDCGGNALSANFFHMFSSGQRLYLRQLDSHSSPQTTRNNARNSLQQVSRDVLPSKDGVVGPAAVEAGGPFVGRASRL